jgi:uncharacterized protein YhaN
MKISEIHVDGFGAWKDLSLGSLSDGVTVFYGPNEAGKTTLMQFIRTVLYGFSPARRMRYLPPVHGGRPGGHILAEDETGKYRLVRHASLDDRPDQLGEVSVISHDGVNHGMFQLENMLSGVDEQTFNNVFAIGLREIQELGTLDDTAAADHLYRLTGGLDRVSLVDVVRELQSSRQKVVGTNPLQLSGSSAPERPSMVTPLVVKRDKLRDEMRELGTRGERWRKLSALRNELLQEANELEKSIADLERRSRTMEIALQCRDIWGQRVEIDRKLESIGLPTKITQKIVDRLNKLNKEIEASKQELAKFTVQRDKIRGDAKALKINGPLWANAPRIAALTEQSPWLETLEGQMERLRTEIRELETRLQGGAPAPGAPGTPAANAVALYDSHVQVNHTAALRKPARLLEEEESKFEAAKRTRQEAKQTLDQLASKIDLRLAERNESDLTLAIARAAERAQMLRKRIKVEQNLDQVGRQREELERYRDELFDRQALPLGMYIILGILCAVSLAAMLIPVVMFFFPDLFGGRRETSSFSTETGESSNWLVGLFSFVLGLIGTMVSLTWSRSYERQAALRLETARRQLAHLHRQHSDLITQRDEIDQSLPAGGGAIDVRLQRADDDLRRLEELVPLNGQREAAHARHEAAIAAEQEQERAANEARNRWTTALRALGLPDNYTLGQARQFSQRGEEVGQLRRQVELNREELQQREREWHGLAARVDQLMGDMRLKPESDQPRLRLAQLAKIIGEQQTLVHTKRDLSRQIRLVKRSYDRGLRGAKRLVFHRNKLFEKMGVRHERDFRKAASRWDEYLALRKSREQLSIRINDLLAQRITEEELDEELSRTDEGTLESRRDSVQVKIRDQRSRLGVAHEKRGQATQEMTTLAEDRRLDQAKVELSLVERQIAQHARKWQTSAATELALTSIRRNYETNRQPETLREASEYLKQLTGGQYTRIWTPIEERALRIDDANGKPIRLDVLSRGTREAVFLSLRLALANSFKRRSQRMPLVLDDVLVNFDTGRVKAAASVIRDFAKTHGHQILMFTCHEHIARLFRDAQCDVRNLPGHQLVEREPEPVVVEPKPRRKKAVEPPPEPEPEPEPIPVALVEPPMHREPIEEVPDFHEVDYRPYDWTTDTYRAGLVMNETYGPDIVKDVTKPLPPPPPPEVIETVQRLVEVQPPKEKKKVIIETTITRTGQRFTWDESEVLWEEPVANEEAEQRTLG